MYQVNTVRLKTEVSVFTDKTKTNLFRHSGLTKLKKNIANLNIPKLFEPTIKRYELTKYSYYKVTI